MRGGGNYRSLCHVCSLVIATAVNDRPLLINNSGFDVRENEIIRFAALPEKHNVLYRRGFIRCYYRPDLFRI